MVRFAVRALILTLIHFAIAVAFVFAWSSEAQTFMTWPAFGSAAGTALFSTPLYQIPAARQHLNYLVGTALNSLLWGVVLALIFSRARRLWLLPLIPLLWFAGLTATASFLEQRVDRDWIARLGNRMPVTQRFAHQHGNASSRRVEPLMRKVVDAFSPVRAPLQKYLTDTFARGDDAVGPVPADVERVLVAERFDLDALESALMSGDPPVWETDLTAMNRPVSITFFSAQRVLLTDALASALANDAVGALQRLESARRLTAFLRTRPETVPVITAVASAENQLGVARKLGIALPAFDARDALVNAFEAESWTDRFLVETSRFDSEWDNRNEVSQTLLNIFVRPYARLCAALSAHDQLRNAVIVHDFPRCVFQPPKYPDEHPWLPNPVEALSAASSATRAARSNRLLLDAEGTEKMARARREGSVTPESMCPDRVWKFDDPVLRLEPPLTGGANTLPTKETISPAGTKSS